MTLIKEIYIKFGKFKNMFSVSQFSSIIKLDISRIFKESQLLNIFFIVVTDDVLKFDKYKDFNFILLNIFSIEVTDDVLKFDKSRDIKLEQPLNKFAIFVISVVLKFVKLISFITQFSNILEIS